MTLDASGSHDYQTLDSDLVVSFDADGTATGAGGTEAQGWTAWSTARTLAQAFTCKGPAACTFSPRVAVRDLDGDVGYATVRLVVVPSAVDLCVVTTSADVDDGATGCAGPFGTDGALSLPEALRISDATSGKQVVTFSGPMTISATGAWTIAADVDVIAPPGVVIEGKLVSILNTPAVLLAGMEIRGQASPLVFPNRTKLTLEDVWVHDMAGIQAFGSATLRRVRMTACGAFCLQTDDPSGVDTLTVVDSALAGGTVGIHMNRCANGKLALDVQTTVLSGFATAMKDDCAGDTRIRHATFHGNGTAIAYGNGNGHVLQNTIFTSQTGTAVTCVAGVGFSARTHHLLFGNAAVGTCVTAADAGTLSGQDPLYVFPQRTDLRLQLASPARNTPLDLTAGGMDLNGSAPGLYSGPGPDRGGREGD